MSGALRRHAASYSTSTTPVAVPRRREMRVERLARQLTPDMMNNPAWALDVAVRLMAYDNAVDNVVGMTLQHNNRIIVHYECQLPARGRCSFVIAKWEPPRTF